MGKLTTHVLDTALGRPAAGLTIELWQMDEKPLLLKTVATNADGRVDGALLDGGTFHAGSFELRFMAGDYLRKFHPAAICKSGPLFLDVIPIRFGIAHDDQHYHVPLLLQPHGYSTYRGS